ncbi:MAG: phosphoribosylformylglycinamidine synthase [Caldilineaceae bacterium]|nr:phosphoribosylformylglycinamidine synthase [Caldilineaceae bacterium]MBP8109959.1 phosphoribosylformylglycinamidine synthase [Caldilineaceae bacterium]MBP8124977.1 phosphoribosylformylglycinamidine synthase [Caldilineaceae bacterium]MBP9074766.1 phosphoribosylformylglycinamidine synthase [Caldilineaceae bacterium]
MTVRIEVRGGRQADAKQIVRQAADLGHRLQACRITTITYLSDNPGAEALSRLCASLLADPVTELARWVDLSRGEISATHTGGAAVEVALRPGVTDVTARETVRGMVELGLPLCEVTTATRYELDGDLSDADLHALANELLCNDTIEHFSLGPIPPQFGAETTASDRVDSVPLAGLDDAALMQISRERLLSLDLAEMRTIQAEFERVGRPPTDVELETLAQTWSEHCVHKTFRALIDFTHLDADGNVIGQETVDGLLNQYIRAATQKVDRDWLRSAFVDDAGIIAFDETHDLAFKVETHNHPSALEPFGGANTGVGGVVRDILGVSARPIATTDFLCFGPQDFPHDQLPAGILHPKRVAAGVVAGIGDYGNKLGLPTVNGAIVYDEGYLGNPLVFCGAVGLLPHGSHPTQAHVGDLIVVLGGRTGRDGLHGATFSSAELTHDTSETSGSAVQIGDPITEKGLIEVLEAARDARLYTAITDCGAGGLSSSVGEMGEALGVDVELTDVPLKYPGLTPWEIWLSEAQERIVMAVPPANLDALQAIADLWDVEIRTLGHFTGDERLIVRYNQRTVADLSMAFLHDGLPRRHMQAVYRDWGLGIRDWGLGIRDSGLGIRAEQSPNLPISQSPIPNPQSLLLTLLAHPSVASKEEVIRRYDHEVRGGTLVRPLTGPQMDGPSDAAVLKPLGTWQHDMAFSLSAGMNPLLGKHDPYAMAVSTIDEAFRNAVAVGADPDRIAILDNFCWGNPTLPDRLGSLVRAAQGCYDGAVAFNTPFISGKDSLYNEFDGQPIPGTLLISAMGIVPDMNRICTSHLKTPGNLLYLLGESRDELGGSLLHHILGVEGGVAPTLPGGVLDRYKAAHRAIRAGLVQSCHDLSEGGLGVAVAEMALAGRLGAMIKIEDLKIEDWGVALFSESNGRLLFEVRPEDVAAFEAALVGHFLVRLGEVTNDDSLVITHTGESVVDVEVGTLVDCWQRNGAG